MTYLHFAFYFFDGTLISVENYDSFEVCNSNIRFLHSIGLLKSIINTNKLSEISHFCIYEYIYTFELNKSTMDV